jgi:hypothetical protein
MALTYNYSHFTSVHFLKRKYEALLTFKVFKQMIENLIEKKIKCLKINCGEGVYVTIFYHLPSWARNLKVVDSIMDSLTKWSIKKEK